MCKWLFCSLVTLATITGCSDETKNAPVKEVKVSSADVEKWPFTFDSATVKCEYQPKAVIEANGKFYALNGAASSQTPPSGFITLTPNVQEWKDNPDISGTKMDIGSVRDKVQDVCKK